MLRFVYRFRPSWSPMAQQICTGSYFGLGRAKAAKERLWTPPSLSWPSEESRFLTSCFPATAVSWEYLYPENLFSLRWTSTNAITLFMIFFFCVYIKHHYYLSLKRQLLLCLPVCRAERWCYDPLRFYSFIRLLFFLSLACFSICIWKLMVFMWKALFRHQFSRNVKLWKQSILMIDFLDILFNSLSSM